MKLRIFVSYVALSGCLMGSACNKAGVGSIPSPQSIPVTDVINQLKVELADFASSTQAAPNVGCGGASGPLNMKVSNVQVELVTSIATTATGSVAATIPIQAITLGPSLSGSQGYNNSETVTLNFNPTDMTGGTAANSNTLNLSNALKALRDQIVKISPAGECLSFNGKKDQTIKLAFSADRDDKGGIKFNILVLAIDAEAEDKNIKTSTLTASLVFSGKNLDAPPTVNAPPIHPRQ